MKYTKLISILLALLLIAGLFAACGGEKDDETQPGMTLPTVDAPAGNGNGDPTAQEQGTKPVSTDDPFTETKDWMPSDQPTEGPGDPSNVPATGETQPAPSEADPSQPAPTGTDPTDPKPSEAVPTYEDSDEDIPVTSTAYLDDTDEDLP